MFKTIVISNQKGGVGKSALAYYLGLKFKEVSEIAFVDTDLQGTLHSFKENSNIDTYTIDDLDTIDKNKYNFLIIDTPPYLSKELPSIIKNADLILIPTKIGLPDFYSMEKTINMIKGFGKEKESLIVFNMVEQKTKILEQISGVLDDYNIPIAKTKIHNRIAYQRGYITLELDNKAQKEIDNLSLEIISKLV
ncbi:ParA family protein [Tenacibaculum finnmarkense]|uniref:ParA family protein n=1 Tax=Tenacibaculum finnmarkense genomovar finnmarkense TaxID=1458503 RepID=A0AAP1RH20_9FLAO|nr:ParA family protein [Tenacibaculum finnmarkense]MBE7653878.1 ParA family protein [Tenacibaculum finnmarkense genomovar finnmarkense]MBE7696181.1 ParA family protein [Tenacibaculum finnmarkense genomovar finnmarkense]MCD8428397.1 ParA family protein [Tenacibaculum finnmarkense genomovar finnmarkense]MCG8732169.1 ParA family protein [Tenacibaculum finnmarkense]MCG8752744.1 ParA family protein [Tenacibaculum finnmarkense]